MTGTDVTIFDPDPASTKAQIQAQVRFWFELGIVALSGKRHDRTVTETPTKEITR